MQYDLESLLVKLFLSEYLNAAKSRWKAMLQSKKSCLHFVMPSGKTTLNMTQNTIPHRRPRNNVKELENKDKKIAPTGGTTQDAAV